MGYGLWAHKIDTCVVETMLDFNQEVTFFSHDLGVRRLPVGDFRKLDVWQVAHKVACEIYHATANFPKTEAYGLTAQLRRSAASISANIAEGCGRRGDAEFSRFVRISLGSATELEYHLLLSHDVGFLAATPYESLSAQVLRIQGMLAGLNRVLKKRPVKAHSA